MTRFDQLTATLDGGSHINVAVKLGGLGIPFGDFRSYLADPPVTSEQLAVEWKPYIETCIEAFGANRCMFESNFPVDAAAGSYAMVWNAFKRLAAGASKAMRRRHFSVARQPTSIAWTFECARPCHKNSECKMSTRRTFVKQAAASAAIAMTAGGLKAAETGTKSNPVAKRLRIKSLILRDETILRNPRVNGDNWHMTWAADDRQYTCLCDGYGDFEPAREGYNSRLLAIEGGPQNIRFHDLPGYPTLAPNLKKDTRYYNFGVLALDGKIYQFLSTWPVPLGAAAMELKDLRYIGVKAIYSPDQGRTWRNQDGSTPVAWEGWGNRGKNNMLFFEEPEDAFSMLSVLQMCKGYASNRDGYVYIYSPNGNTEGTMNELVMFRVPKARILDRKAYEYFAGLRADGSAKWTEGMEARAVVYTFPRGWVNKTDHPWAWIPSVAYNEALGMYMMANWATGPGPEPKVEWFSKPSYLGFWVAPNPWGPWTQIHEDTAWTPGGDIAARCYSPIVAPKWIAPDGKSFWLVWTDFQQRLPKDEVAKREKASEALAKPEMIQAKADLDRLNRPYYSFNLQRVDLSLA